MHPFAVEEQVAKRHRGGREWDDAWGPSNSDQSVLPAIGRRSGALVDGLADGAAAKCARGLLRGSWIVRVKAQGGRIAEAGSAGG